jgi:FtsH-binding integral membrane protein
MAYDGQSRAVRFRLITINGEETLSQPSGTVQEQSPVYEYDRRDSLARTYLTFTLALVLAGSVIAAWVFYATSANNALAFQHLETMVGVIITPVLSLFSAAVGFYYGRRGRS